MHDVLVLMSTYNGERYLREQLDSLRGQVGVNCRVLVRDDGSQDGTPDILREYSEKMPLSFFSGENLGYAKSFWTLLQSAGESDYYAFCDQDDLWFPDKLSSAVALLEKNGDPSLPALYTSNVICADASLTPMEGTSFEGGERSFYESLCRSYLPGCTFVFNRAARNAAMEYNGFMESHDWILYSIVAGLGRVVYDEASHILYRLHGNNTLGYDNAVKRIMTKLRRFLKPSRRTRSRSARDIYDTFGDRLPEEHREAAFRLGHYLLRGGRRRLLADPHFSGLLFKLYIILGRV